MANSTTLEPTKINALRQRTPNVVQYVHTNPIYTNNANTETGAVNAKNSSKISCVKMTENPVSTCNNFKPLDQGSYGICWYASVLHSILMSERIREVLVKNIAQMLINYINPEDKKEMLQEILEPVVGGALCFKINEYYTGTMRRFIKHLFIIFFSHLMSDDDIKALKLNQKKECEWLYDFARNGPNAKDKHLQTEQSSLLKKIATYKNNLSQTLERQLNQQLPNKNFKVDLWKYTDMPSMWRAILDAGGKSHYAVFPFLFYLFNFQGCLPIHITNYTIQNKKELDDVLDTINAFINNNYIQQGFPKPDIISITCNISTGLTKHSDAIGVSSVFGQKPSQNAPKEQKQTEYISEYIGSDYTLESANLYVEDDRSSGHVIAGIKCGQEKFILNSWTDDKGQQLFGKGSKTKDNWLDTRVSIKDFYRHTLHTLNYVSITTNTNLRYAAVEQDLYKLWKNYQLGNTDVAMNGGFCAKDKKQFRQQFIKQTEYYLKKYNSKK